MVILTDDDKKILKRIGYDECAKIIKKSKHYIRGLASKGDRRMRKSDLDKLRKHKQ
jgi:hypothetical protein